MTIDWLYALLLERFPRRVFCVDHQIFHHSSSIRGGRLDGDHTYTASIFRADYKPCEERDDNVQHRPSAPTPGALAAMIREIPADAPEAETAAEDTPSW